ncbi:MAG: MlaD family protein [Vulcanimicrobiaceae bacterium]
MNKQAQVGLFTILGLIAVFAVFYVLSDFGARARGYKIGVRFESAAGLHSAALVYLSGVRVGVVDQIELLPDYSTRVILAIKPGYDIPVGSRFLIQAPLTGEPTVLIVPPAGATRHIATLPHEILPIGQEPVGANPATISDLLAQGQGEVKRLDAILATLQSSEPRLLHELQGTLANANALTRNANQSLTALSGQGREIADTLQASIAVSSRNLNDLTGRLDATVAQNSGQVNTLLAQLVSTSKSFGKTVDALQGIATDPSVKRNFLSTARDFALTAKTFAALTGDLRTVTGDPQTQAQLRDTVAQLDATSQRVDSLLAELGGRSSVYGVDEGATPAPVPSPTPPGYVPTSAPLIPATPASPAAAPPLSGSKATPAPGIAALRARLNRFTSDLVQLQVRVGVLSAQRPGSANRNVSPLLTADRGPQSDVNLLVLPHGSTGLILGADDIGSGTSTATALLVHRRAGFSYGGGVEYSRLGLVTTIAGRTFGFEGRAYDLRHPTFDGYLNAFIAPKFQLFGGERDLLHSSRRTVIGLQFEL